MRGWEIMSGYKIQPFKRRYKKRGRPFLYFKRRDKINRYRALWTPAYSYYSHNELGVYASHAVTSFLGCDCCESFAVPSAHHSLELTPKEDAIYSGL